MLIIGFRNQAYFDQKHDYIIYSKSMRGECSTLLISGGSTFILYCNNSDRLLEYPESFHKAIARGFSPPTSDIHYINFTYIEEGSYKKFINQVDMQWPTNSLIVLPNSTYEKIEMKYRCAAEHITYLHLFLNSMFKEEPAFETIKEIANMLKILRSNVSYYGTSRSDRFTYRMIKTNPVLFISKKIYPVEDEKDLNLANHHSPYLSEMSYSINMNREYYDLFKKKIKDFFVYAIHIKGESVRVVSLEINTDLYLSRDKFDTFKLVIGVRGDLITLMNRAHFFRVSSPLYWATLFLSQMAMVGYLESELSEANLRIPREYYHEINIKRKEDLAVLEITPIFFIHDSYSRGLSKCFGLSLSWYGSTTLIIYYMGEIDNIYGYITMMGKEELIKFIHREISGKKPHLVCYQMEINERNEIVVFWFKNGIAEGDNISKI